MLDVKNIGKPCAGEPHARFDEGGQVNPVMLRLLRHHQTKGVETDRPRLKQGKPVLYSTQSGCMLWFGNFLSIKLFRGDTCNIFLP